MPQDTQTLIKILQEFQKIDPEFPLQYAICLAEISQNKGISLTELSENVQIPLSTVSRIIASLADTGQRKKPYNLVNISISSVERRRKEIELTTDGKNLMRRIHRIMNK